MILSRLRDQLIARYGEEWHDMEPETISLDLGVILDPVSLQGVQVLRTIHQYPELFLEDPMYFLNFCETANNHILDESHMPSVTSLELAWALVELKRLLPEGSESVDSSEMIRKVCKYILREEGYSEPVPPFTGFLKSDDFYDGQTPDATANKAKGIRLYIAAMEKTNGLG